MELPKLPTPVETDEYLVEITQVYIKKVVISIPVMKGLELTPTVQSRMAATALQSRKWQEATPESLMDVRTRIYPLEEEDKSDEESKE